MIFLISLFLGSALMNPTVAVGQPVYQTDRLYVMYDTGETVPFLAEMAHHIRNGKDFRFIAEGSAVNSLKVQNCENDPALFEKIMARRITFEELGIAEKIDATEWPRERKITKDSKTKIQEHVFAKVVITGSASRMQKQIATHIKSAKSATHINGAKKVVFVDNVDYKKSDLSFKTVEYVLKHADVVMCPCKYTCSLFVRQDGETRRFEVVGSPTLETWNTQIQQAGLKKGEILAALKSSGKPIVAIMDAYDSNPKEPVYGEIVSPLFKELAAQLELKGYQVIIQPHPKVAKQIVPTPELLSVSEYVIGYNSQTVFFSAVLGKKAVYVIPKLPDDRTFSHFCIDKGYVPAIFFSDKAEVPAQLLKIMEILKTEAPKDIQALEQMPLDSINKIDAVIQSLLG